MIASITEPSFTLFNEVGSTSYCLPAELVATWLIAADVQATPSISNEIAAVPVVVALLCAKILTILPPSGTTTTDGTSTTKLARPDGSVSWALAYTGVEGLTVGYAVDDNGPVVLA